MLPHEDPLSFSSLLDQSSVKAAQARSLAALRVSCNPHAVVPLSQTGPVAPSCRAAKTRAACAAAAAPGALVEYGRNAPPIPKSVLIPYGDADVSEGEHDHDGTNLASAGGGDAEPSEEEEQAPSMPLEELEERLEIAREAGATCNWLRLFETEPADVRDDGACVAEVVGMDARTQTNLDSQVAMCMGDNEYAAGSTRLLGCREGHAFCTSVEIDDSPGSYACMHAAVKDVEMHRSWFYYYLRCSGRVGEGWEAFCSLARASFYENLGCPECGTVADAAAPHQALCATATTPAACARLSDSLQ